MKMRLFSPHAARFSRLLSLVLAALFGLAGADCGGGSSGNSNTDNPPLDGGQPKAAPPPTPQQTLVTLLNSQIRSGLGQLTTDSIATTVAQAHSDYMLSTNQLTEVMKGQDFTTRLIAGGAQAPVNSTNVVARGFSDPQALITAILANQTILQDLQGNNYTHIGVGFSGPGAGNYWTILLY